MGFFKDIGNVFSKPAGIIGAALKDVPVIGDAFSAYGEQQAAHDQNVAAKDSANAANAFSAAQADKQMAFQERMSSTSHQREVEDLKKAGLNPILSANSGSSSPSGASATGQQYSSVALPAGRFLASAREGDRYRNEMKTVKLMQKNIDMDYELKREQAEQIFEGRRGSKLENDFTAKRNRFFEDHPTLYKIQAAAGGLNALSSGASSAGGLLRLLLK